MVYRSTKYNRKTRKTGSYKRSYNKKRSFKGRHGISRNFGTPEVKFFRSGSALDNNAGTEFYPHSFKPV